jgi:hypothetical protein
MLGISIICRDQYRDQYQPQGDQKFFMGCISPSPLLVNVRQWRDRIRNLLIATWYGSGYSWPFLYCCNLAVGVLRKLRTVSVQHEQGRIKKNKSPQRAPHRRNDDESNCISGRAPHLTFSRPPGLRCSFLPPHSPARGASLLASRAFCSFGRSCVSRLDNIWTIPAPQAPNGASKHW